MGVRGSERSIPDCSHPTLSRSSAWSPLIVTRARALGSSKTGSRPATGVSAWKAWTLCGPRYYFDDPADLLYDRRLDLIPNLDHILDQRFDRWPDDWATDLLQRRIMLDGAVREAGKRVQLNWRLAIPQFYCPGGRHDGRIRAVAAAAALVCAPR